MSYALTINLTLGGNPNGLCLTQPDDPVVVPSLLYAFDFLDHRWSLAKKHPSFHLQGSYGWCSIEFYTCIHECGSPAPTLATDYQKCILCVEPIGLSQSIAYLDIVVLSVRQQLRRQFIPLPTALASHLMTSSTSQSICLTLPTILHGHAFKYTELETCLPDKVPC
jgi:hypothetical protein